MTTLTRSEGRRASQPDIVAQTVQGQVNDVVAKP